MKGRHFPLDVLFGAVAGMALGLHMESHSRRAQSGDAQDVRARHISLSLPLLLLTAFATASCLQAYLLDYSSSQWAKAVCGTVVGVEWSLYYGIPLLARGLAPAVLSVLTFLDEVWAGSHHREARGVAWWIVAVPFFGIPEIDLCAFQKIARWFAKTTVAGMGILHCFHGTISILHPHVSGSSVVSTPRRARCPVSV